ncbi:MAG: hypothetical protein M5U09_01380 [Gammaproteobacteria bacterium]|nr:hypothetical protein [Gammaproteobacteria bacterium]
MLLDGHHLYRVDTRRVVPRQVQMGVDQSGHQRHAAPVDPGLAIAAEAEPAADAAAPDRLYPVARHRHLAAVRRLAGGIEDAHVGEHDLRLAAVHCAAASPTERTFRHYRILLRGRLTPPAPPRSFQVTKINP